MGRKSRAFLFRFGETGEVGGRGQAFFSVVTGAGKDELFFGGKDGGVEVVSARIQEILDSVRLDAGGLLSVQERDGGLDPRDPVGGEAGDKDAGYLRAGD